MKILVACEESQRVCIEFRRLWHDAWSCDILDASWWQPNRHIKWDVADAIPMGRDMMIAFPPCTHLCSSWARRFAQKRKDGRQQSWIDFFMNLVNAPIPKIAIENPIGIMSTQYRKPDQIIQPWQFWHWETKATCLRLKWLPKLEPTKIVPWRENKVHKWFWLAWSSNECKRQRSKTYPGIAEAMAKQRG
jgi:hypothetical protein